MKAALAASETAGDDNVRENNVGDDKRGSRPRAVLLPRVAVQQRVEDEPSAVSVPPAKAEGEIGVEPGAQIAAEEDKDDESKEPPAKPPTVAGRYKVGKKIGSGSYSEVHVGVDAYDGSKVAIKFEWTQAERGRRLLWEAELYKEFNNGEHTPRIFWWGTQQEWNILVMELLGPSLEDLFRGRGRKFSIKTVVMLGVQMVDRLEYVHSKNILHRDIKPHNFLMGVGEHVGRVYIMDFGLAQPYIDAKTGTHIPCRTKRGLTGTVRYTTMNVHRGYEPSRRDDLGAVGYVLMHFNRGKLPWQGIDARSKRTKQRKIGKCKEKTSFAELCHGWPKEFCKFLEVCDEMAYAEKPDYSHLRQLLLDVAARHQFEIDLQFDWMMTPEAVRAQELEAFQAAYGVPMTMLPPRLDEKKRPLESGELPPAPKRQRLVEEPEEEDEDQYDQYSYYYESEEEESEEGDEEESVEQECRE